MKKGMYIEELWHEIWNRLGTVDVEVLEIIARDLGRVIWPGFKLKKIHDNYYEVEGL